MKLASESCWSLGTINNTKWRHRTTPMKSSLRFNPLPSATHPAAKVLSKRSLHLSSSPQDWLSLKNQFPKRHGTPHPLNPIVPTIHIPWAGNFFHWDCPEREVDLQAIRAETPFCHAGQKLLSTGPDIFHFGSVQFDFSTYWSVIEFLRRKHRKRNHLCV